MSFEILDIEQTPRLEHGVAFHCILATNTIQATRNLDVSLRNLQGMLREDGVLTLVEITRQVFWLDVVFGQFEGWWLSDDRRSHALIDESSGRAGCGRLVSTRCSGRTACVPSRRPCVSSVHSYSRGCGEDGTYECRPRDGCLQAGNLEIHADVHYPAGGVLPEGKMPGGTYEPYYPFAC